jgi:hypothetical protein
MQLSASGGEGYIAVGCTSGIYVSKRATDHCESPELPHIPATNSVAHSISESPGIQRTEFNGCYSRVQEVPCPL